MDSKGKQLLASTGQSLEKISRLFGINLSSYLGRLYGFALLALFVFLNHMSWHEIYTGHCAQHIISKFMIILQYVLHILLVSTMVITSLFCPKQFAFPCQEMFIIDSILESYGAQFSDKDIFIMKHMQDAAMMAISLLMTMRFLYEIIANNSELIWYSILSWYNVDCLLIINGLFCHYVNDIYLRFQQLNKIVIQHSKDKLSIFYIDFTTETYDKRNYLVINKIRSIQRIHYALTILAMKLLISSALSLSAIILYLYSIYYNIIANSQSELIVFQIIIVFYNALLSLYISYVCQRTRNESRQMTKILHDVFLKHKSMRSEVVYFSLQLVHQDLMFTACGLYEIDIPLICSIVGAVITYVVMVIQLNATDKFIIANNEQNYVGDNSTSVNGTA